MIELNSLDIWQVSEDVHFVMNKIISSTELKFFQNFLYDWYFLCHFESKQKIICWNMDSNDTLTDSQAALEHWHFRFSGWEEDFSAAAATAWKVIS